MIISNQVSPVRTESVIPSASTSAIGGLQAQQRQLERNVTEVARNEASNTEDRISQDRALVEQGEIVRAVQANALSLEAAGERIGTLVDISV